MHVSSKTHIAYYEIVRNDHGCRVRWYWYKRPEGSKSIFIEETQYNGPDSMKMAKQAVVVKARQYEKPGTYVGVKGWFDRRKKEKGVK